MKQITQVDEIPNQLMADIADKLSPTFLVMNAYNAGLCDGSKHEPFVTIPNWLWEVFCEHDMQGRHDALLATLNAFIAGPPVLIPQLTTDPPKCFRCGRPESQHGNAWHDCLVFVPPTPAPAADDARCGRCGKTHFEGDCKLDPTYADRHVIAPSPVPADMKQLRNVAAWAVHHHAYGGIHDSKSILKGNADRRIKEAAAGDLGKSAPDPEQDCKCPVCSPAHTAEQILIDATLEISEARKDFNTLDERPEQVITITRHGRPVFAVVKLNYLEVLQRPASIAQPTADQAGEVDPMQFQDALEALEHSKNNSDLAGQVSDLRVVVGRLIATLRKRGGK